MTELFVGATPRELIPGDVEAIAQLGRRLDDIAVGCREAADQLGGLRAADWSGEAAEAFADALDQEPGKYARAAEAFKDAALAVRRYFSALEEAQRDAQRAIDLFEVATVRQAKAQAEAEIDPPETIDPDIAQARSIFETARERVEYAAGIAARHLSDAADMAPNKPSWRKRLLDGAGDFFGGAAEATWGTAKFAWSVSTVRRTADPLGWVRDMKGIGEGLIWGAIHPVEFGKAIIDWETWKENPARAAGRLVPDIALTLATAGAGAASRGARAAEKASDAAEDLRAAERATDAAADLRAAERTAATAEEARAAIRTGSRVDHHPAKSPKMDDERRLRLQKDSDHGGDITDNSLEEAEIAEDLEARGILDGVDRRSIPSQGDFFDSSGQKWDIKSPKSREALEESINAELRERGLPERTFDPNRPIKGQFNPQRLIPDMKRVIDTGKRIVLDSRDLNEKDLRTLRDAIEQEGLGDHFIWYP